MNSVCIEKGPKLAPPGAGLPLPELLIARALFRWRRLTKDRAFFTRHFQLERARIQNLTHALDAETGSRRVLIARPRGLEDSSRFWSVWMTLDHLRIVHEGIAQTIALLARGKVPPRKVSTADVKPTPEATSAIIEAYEKSCDAILTTVSQIQNLKTKARLAHPWFGPLDAAAWHALAAGHHQIHRTQIQRILAGL